MGTAGIGTSSDATGRIRRLTVWTALAVAAVGATALAGLWHPATPPAVMRDYLPEITLGTVLVAGLVDAINPCAFTVLLLLITSLLATLRPEDDHVRALRGRIVWRGAIFVAAIFITYLGLGAGILGGLDFLATGHWPTRAAALLAILLGLWMMKDVFLPDSRFHLHAPPAVAGMARAAARRGTVPALLGAGFLIGLCTVPCSGAVYLGVLSLLAAQPSRLTGFGYLVLYNVIFVLPLLGIILAATVPAFLRRLARWNVHHRERVRLALGSGVVLMGLAVLATM
jgi:cytochrome c biogenesis protein CcdA